MPTAPSNRPRLVILGGGFAGLYAARALKRAPLDITVIDRRNHHLFQPLLYQVATAALNPSDIAAPIRGVLRRQRNASVILGEAVAVDMEKRIVELADGRIGYDFLLVATGATHSYFAHPEWERAAPGLKSIEDALEIRRRVLLAFEAAERESDPERQMAWLTFVVIGGGPTGVELAGALSEIARKTLTRDFRHFDPGRTRVVLVEGFERLLPLYPADLSERAERQLRALGVEVITGVHVTEVDSRAVRVGQRIIPARTVLWAAGVQASPLARSLGLPLDRAGRVVVDATLSPPGHPEVFVAGDVVSLTQDGKAVPGIAPAAIQQGRYAAREILRALEGKARRPFRYLDKGSLATIGRAAAVAEFGPIHLSGFIAWFAWLAIHIFFLIGFRNRFLVIFEWAWAYLTYQRGARLITGEVEPVLRE
jgi:NADH:ubiquinone reductase (H+-translocating)